MEEQNNPYRGSQNRQEGNINNNYYQDQQEQNNYSINQYRENEHYSQNLRYGQYGQSQTNKQPRYNNQVNPQQYSHRTEQENTSQQGMMIKNQEMNIVHSIEMNDRDYLNDILATEKYLTDGFNTFAREASHTALHNDIRTILDETHDCTRNIFNLMFKDGFYSFQAASQQEVAQTEQKFTKYLSQQNPYTDYR